jgi:serine/threonine-protein kinase RsbW
MARIKVPAELQHVREACEFVVQALTDAGMGDDFRYCYELSVDEVCTNIVEHGYKQTTGVIELVLEQFADRFQLSIIDDAPPFNPLEHAPPANTTNDPDGLSAGGWGIVFTRKKMDNVFYRYAHGRNHLTLEKFI